MLVTQSSLTASDLGSLIYASEKLEGTKTDRMSVIILPYFVESVSKYPVYTSRVIKQTE
jgi:hypothetical protein